MHDRLTPYHSHRSLPRLLSALGMAVLCSAPALAWQDSSGAMPAAGQSSASKTPLNKADQSVLQDLARGHIAEVDLARVALTKSQDPKVRTYAQRMVDDHGRALQEVQQFAQAHNVTLPSEPDAKHAAMQKQMEALSGANFDRQYLARGGVTDHAEMHRKLQRAEKDVQNSELKALVARTVPIVDEHRSLAAESRDQSGAASTGSSGTSGSAGISMPQTMPPSTPESGTGSGTGSGTRYPR